MSVLSTYTLKYTYMFMNTRVEIQELIDKHAVPNTCVHISISRNQDAVRMFSDQIIQMIASSIWSV